MGARGSAPARWCLEFEAWVEATVGAVSGGGPPPPPEEAGAVLGAWRTAAPFAAEAHPPDSPGEHLLPFLFAFGAGGATAGCLEHKEYLGSLPMAAYSFGDPSRKAKYGWGRLAAEDH